MKTIGIVAEYNPFHLGHAWHIQESRRQVSMICPASDSFPREPAASAAAGKAETGETAVIAVMSGDFVQRGEAAVYSKFARAEAACRSGADLVVELPLPWAISSAEGFAQGAVSLLSALGADFLSFGCEMPKQTLASDRQTVPELSAGVEADSGENLLCELRELAALLTEPGFTSEILRVLKENPSQSFAAARQTCAEERLGRALPLLQQPNNILALEYIKAIRDLHLQMEPLVIPRRGADHDEVGESTMPSAFELRTRLRGGQEVSAFIPAEAELIFSREREAGRTAMSRERQNLLMLSRLRFLSEEDCLSLPGAGDGLGRRLYHAIHSESSYDSILAATATRRYPLSRVRRLCTAAAIGLREENLSDLPPFARVLAFNEKGRMLLNRIAGQQDQKEQIPVLVKPSHILRMERRAQRVFSLGAEAHDFYTLFYPDEREHHCGEDWRHGPVLCL